MTIAPTSRLAASGLAVLVIDDEVALARNLCVYLDRLGYVAETAGSAEEGLARAAELRPDIVLLDHNLPGQSGLSLLPRLREQEPAARIVLMTGHGSLELAVQAMKAGAVDYLSKPLVLGELKLLLERLSSQQRLETAVGYYAQREAQSSGLDQLRGESPPMRALRDRIERLLASERQLGDAEAPAVLIQGETGTGKELVARALHYGGPRAGQPFVELNCGALPPQLVESELFGHERGAFTDARERKAGLVETAEGGSLFLDEIGEADPGVQVKLLKLLEDRRFRRLGGLRDQRVDLRILSATHQPLDTMVQQQRFRADLYYRLRIVELVVPPLRERGDDILALAEHFIALHARRYRRPPPRLSLAAEAALRRHRWPGNVRELRNGMEQAVLLAGGTQLDVDGLGFLGPMRAPEPTAAGPQPLPAAEGGPLLPPEADLHLERMERRHIETALARSGDNITHAARLLGISRDTLRYRLERLGLRGQGGG